MTGKRVSQVMGLIISTFLLAYTLPLGLSQIMGSTKGSKGDWQFEYEGKRLTITAYSGTESNLEIPSKIDGKNVIAIDRCAFEDNKTLVSVTVPNGVTRIGFSAFKGCENLESITLPKSLRVIESFAFNNCYKLDGVILPENLRSLGGHSFSNCEALKEITVPEKCKDIGDAVFSYCHSLEKADIKGRTKWIPGRLFWDCSKLTEFTIPYTVRFVRSSAFGCCYMIKTVRFNDECREVGGCFWDNSMLETVIFGRKTVKLGYEVLGSCKLVATLVIPESVTEIDEGFFSRYYGDKIAITVVTTEGSYAEKWAKSLNMQVAYNIDDYYK